MNRKQAGAIFGALVLAVVAPLLVLGVLRGLDGETEAAPALQLADLKKLDLAVVDPPGIPPQLPVSEEYWFQLVEHIHNNVGPAMAVWSVTECHPPEGGMCSYHCQGGEIVTLNGVVIDQNCQSCTTYYADGNLGEYLDVHIFLGPVDPSVDVFLFTDWDIHCLEPSTHEWYFWNEVYDEVEPDPDPDNNWQELYVSVDCIAEADVKEMDFWPTLLPGIVAPLPYPVVEVGQTGEIEMTKLAHNNGWWEPVDVLITPSHDILGYIGQSIDPNACTLTGPPPFQVPDLWESVDLPVPYTYDLNCGMGGIEQDDDGDTLIDEDPVNGVDDDGDYGPNPYGACPSGDPGCDEDSPFYLVNLYFDNYIEAKDIHIEDPLPDNNFSEYGPLALAVVRPFTPYFEYNAGTTDADQQWPPLQPDTCYASPGYGCKTQAYVEIPAGGLGGPPGTQPLAAIATVLGDAAGDFMWTSSAAMTLGEKVGYSDFQVQVPIGHSCLAGGTVPLAGSLDIYNACLPPSAYGGIINYVPDDRCLVDTASQASALELPDALSSWSSALDTIVAAVQGASPTAFLWARYTGDIIVGSPDVPVNALVFDLSGGAGDGPWLTQYWVDNPLAPSFHSCGPYMADMVLLGQTPNTAEMVKYCAVSGVHGVTGYLTRADTGTMTTVPTSVICSAVADLEKVDLQVKPFYCADSDLDGLEDYDAAAGTTPGTGNCCDGVDNDADTATDGQDTDCQPYHNEDPPDGIDNDNDGLYDEDPATYYSGQSCPWNGDDDCWGDGPDEDPKNDFDDDGDAFIRNEDGTIALPMGMMGNCIDGIDNDGDTFIDANPPNPTNPDPECMDEDPANGFLGIDNDEDGLVDEDGAGRFDFNGNTFIDPCVEYETYGWLCEEQLQSVDDDGDTEVDEDPLDSPVPVPTTPSPVQKWVQEPDLQIGVDVHDTWFDDAGWGYALADDYPCTTTGPITDIYFWGSWLFDIFPGGDPNNVSFTLSIHEDMPSPPEPYSHPGPELWSHTYLPGECTVVASAEPLLEDFIVPPFAPIGWDTIAFRYHCPGPDPAEFIQRGTVANPVVYWLDIQAHLDETEGAVFGWKTSADQWNDWPVWATLPKPPEIPEGAWQPLEPFEDLAFEIFGYDLQPHEPHYLVKEYLLNRGPEPLVLAEDIKELDAPHWRVDALEDGRTTCNDGLDNDSGPCNDSVDNDRDGYIDLDDLDCGGNPAGTEGDGLTDGFDPDCQVPNKIWEEGPAFHACNDGLDNGTGRGLPPDGADEGDSDCASLTEVSVECKSPDDLITLKGNVAWYIKPPSIYELPGCEEYYDPDHFNKCVPCKVYMGVTPPEGASYYCYEITQGLPGFCIAADSTEGVVKELDYHQYIELGYRTHNMHLVAPGGLDPAVLVDPISTVWHELYPTYSQYWHLASWEDNGDGVLSPSDQIDMEMIMPETWEPGWFHVDEITETVCLDDPIGPVQEPEKCIEPIPPASITEPFGFWHEKWPGFSGECQILDWLDDPLNPDGVLSPSDRILLLCPDDDPPEPIDWHVDDVAWDLWLTEKVPKVHQFDLSCEGQTSLHKFLIQNEIWPAVEEINNGYGNGYGNLNNGPALGAIDPDPTNNAMGIEMLVGCMKYAWGQVSNLRVPSPDGPNTWDVFVSKSEIQSVQVDVANAGPFGPAPYPADFVLELEEESPGTPGLADSDGDDWADLVEAMHGSDTGNPFSTPESLHALNDPFANHFYGQPSCSDGLDNDGNGLFDASDPKCQDSDDDGYSDVDEFLFNSDPGNPASTPEHMQFPWTCDDGVDNDGDGHWDHGNVPPEDDEPDDDGDSVEDCSNGQLVRIRPTVLCVSGWKPQPGDTEYMYVYGDGTVTVGLSIPLNNLQGTISDLTRELVLHCFEVNNPYPAEQVIAHIGPKDVHQIDLNYHDDWDNDFFDGSATCEGGMADLELVSWTGFPVPTDFPDNFHVSMDHPFTTTKEIYNRDPGGGVAASVRVEKKMNVPLGCDGALKVEASDETVRIENGVKYNINGGFDLDPGLWLDGPAKLEVGDELVLLDWVFVQAAPPAYPQERSELSAWFTAPDSPLDPGETTYVDENFNIHCREADPDTAYLFENTVTIATYPDICDPDLNDIYLPVSLDVDVLPDADGDTVPDGEDNCPDVPNPGQENNDLDYPSPGDGPKGDACDNDDDQDGWEDTSEVAGGGGANPAQDTIPSDPFNDAETPEVCDGQDNDLNEGVDEGFPDTTLGGPKDCMDNAYDADSDAPAGGDPQRGGNAEDTNDDSWFTGGAWHHDMFPDTHENFAGTKREVDCAPTVPQGDNDPFDTFWILLDGMANVFDVMQYYVVPQAYGSRLYPDDDGYNRRFDLFTDATMQINVFDIMQYYAVPQAFGNACPYGK